jgi:hypothetical protein
MIHLLAARALVQNFEDKAPMSHSDKAQVLRLALRYGLSSSQTSFVAVDHTNDRYYEAEYMDYSSTQRPAPKARARVCLPNFLPMNHVLT